MSTETQRPDGELSDSGLVSSVVTDHDADPDSDSSVTAATGNNVNTEYGVDFPSPTGEPSIGAGLQEFRAGVIEFDSGQTGTPTARIELWENGTLVRAGSNANISTFQVLSFTWNANELSTSDGSLVQCKVIGAKTGGGPGKRNTVNIGQIEWNVTFSSNVNVEAGVDALTLTEFQSSVNAETNVNANADELTLTTYQASVLLGADTNILANVHALTLVENQASISLNVDISATTHALTLIENQANVNLAIDIAANTDALTLTEHQASILTTSNTNINAGVHELILVGIQANINAGISITASVDALSLTEYSATVSFIPDTNVDINANVHELDLISYQSNITRNINVLANSDTLLLTGYQASLSFDIARRYTYGKIKNRRVSISNRTRARR